VKPDKDLEPHELEALTELFSLLAEIEADNEDV
jgi:hypothetical protein